MHRFELAIAAIFRNEAPYLREWIEFHRAVGFSHFYLFNNLSTDGYSSVLQPYVDRGIVDLVCWPLEHDQCLDWSLNQCLAYERALQLAKGQAKWLAIIDTDEFLFPTKESSLPALLSRYDEHVGIGVNWQLFGTSGVEKIPEDRLLIEMLQYGLPSEAPANHLIKSIVRPEFVVGCESSHCVKYLPGWGHVNTDRVRFEGKSSPYVQVDALRINHYQVRDEHYLRTQKLPRVLKWWSLQPAERWEALYASYNQVQDLSIQRFVPTVYSRLNSSM